MHEKRPILTREDARLAALAEHRILDTETDEAFDALVRIAADACDVPIAAISLIDAHRQWLKASIGLEGDIPRLQSFCAHTLGEDVLLEIEDATADSRFAGNPLVTGEPNIRFYAGRPLITPHGHALGALCVIDSAPRRLTAHQRDTLRDLGRVAERLLEAHRLAVANDALAEAVDNAESAFRTAPIAMVVAATDGTIISTNAVMQKLLGRSEEELRGVSMLDIAHPGDRLLATHNLERVTGPDAEPLSIERRWVDAAGHSINVLISATLVRSRDGTPSHIVVQAQDISERHRIEAALADAARRDELTGLANRRAFSSALNREWALSTRDGIASYVVALDLDGLKRVNDTLGHAAGDEALRALGEALAVSGRETDVLARVGGDEFAAILVRSQEVDAPAIFAERVRHAFHERTVGFNPPVDVSIGYTSLVGTQSPDEAVAIADAAMYEVKRTRHVAP